MTEYGFNPFSDSIKLRQNLSAFKKIERYTPNGTSTEIDVQNPILYLNEASMASPVFDGTIPKTQRTSLLWSIVDGQATIAANVGGMIRLYDSDTASYVWHTVTDIIINSPSGSDDPEDILTPNYIIITFLGDGIDGSMRYDTPESTYVTTASESWEDKSLGTDGWILSLEGNAIFNNVAIRGEIEATSLSINSNEAGDETTTGIYWNGDPEDPLYIGSDVTILGTVTAEALTLNEYNYWTPTLTGADFRAGGADAGIFWDGTTFEIRGDLVTGTLGASSGGINGWNISEGLFASGETTTYVALSASPSNPYSIWAGGEAASTAPFSVKRDGTLNATNAVIEGEITATTIDIGGTDGITYNGTTVTIGSDVTINADVTVQGLRITSENGSSVLTIDNNVNGANDGIYINANNYWYTDGKFSVGNSTKSLVWDNTNLSLTGNIYAVGGTIGGFTIGEDSLTAGTGSTSIGINTIGHPFYAGNAVPESAPFKVTSTGELTATNANITGAITATSGTFTGEVNATSGTISGDFTITGNTKISGSVFVGSSPTTGQRISINGSGIIGIDNSDIVVFNLPAVGNETPTIRNFNALETKITGEGENAYLIAGTTGASATNVIVRGDKTGGQAAAIYSTINGTATSATSGNGFYVDDTGKFRFAQGTNVISGSGGNLSVTGSINATSGYIGGSSSGWLVDSDLISNDLVGFYAPSVKSGTVTANSSINNIGSNTFITASTTVVPKIGMAIIGPSSLSLIPLGTYITNVTGSSPTYTITMSNSFVFLNASQTFSVSEYAIYAGNSSRSIAPFKVDYFGNLTATNADISGRINATSGTFTGAINATSGYIGGNSYGWQIGNSYLVGGAYENVGMLASSQYGIRKNIMQNPSLEQSAVGYVASGAGTTISRVSTDAYSGSFCLQVTKSGTLGSGVSLYQNSGERYPIDPPVLSSSSGSTGQKYITVTSSTGISIGMSVTGTNIPSGTLVSGIYGTRVALTKAVTAVFSSQTITFTKTYWAGAFVKVPTGDETTTLNTFIDYYNSSGSIVYSSSNIPQTIAVGGGWVFIYSGFTAISSASSFVFSIKTVSPDLNTAGKRFLVDGAIIEVSNSLNSPYFFDGDSRLEGFTPARWLGEVGLSASETSLIAFWAGSNVNTRESAPFSVGYDGYLSASNVNITGKINATSGYIGGISSGWLINSNVLVNDSGEYGAGLIATESPVIQKNLCLNANFQESIGNSYDLYIYGYDSKELFGAFQSYSYAADDAGFYDIVVPDNGKAFGGIKLKKSSNISVSGVTGANNSITLVLPSSAESLEVYPSLFVSGTGIPLNTRVTSIYGNEVLLDKVTTGVVSGTVTFLNEFRFTKSATGTSGSSTITVSPNNTGIKSTMKVIGTGIASDTNVVSVSGNVITLSKANTGPVSGTVTFFTENNDFIRHYGGYEFDGTTAFGDSNPEIPYIFTPQTYTVSAYFYLPDQPGSSLPGRSVSLSVENSGWSNVSSLPATLVVGNWIRASAVISLDTEGAGSPEVVARVSGIYSSTTDYANIATANWLIDEGVSVGPYFDEYHPMAKNAGGYSIRYEQAFYSGSTYLNRESAPLQLGHGGNLYAINGKIGSLLIDAKGLVGNDGSDFLIGDIDQFESLTEFGIRINFRNSWSNSNFSVANTSELTHLPGYFTDTFSISSSMYSYYLNTPLEYNDELTNGERLGVINLAVINDITDLGTEKQVSAIKSRWYNTDGNPVYSTYLAQLNEFTWIAGPSFHVYNNLTSGGGLRAQGTVVKFDGVYNRTTTAASNMLIATSPLAEVFRSTSSSQRWKNSVEELSGDLSCLKLLEIPVRQFKFNNDYLDENDSRFDKLVPGFVAEEVAEHYPIAAEFGEDGAVEDWNIRMLVPPMLKLIQEQDAKIKDLEIRLASIENN
jgi:hypothetical protein